MGIVISYSRISSKTIVTYFHFVCLRAVPVYMCTTCMTGAHRGQRALELLKLVTEDYEQLCAPLKEQQGL